MIDAALTQRRIMGGDFNVALSIEHIELPASFINHIELSAKLIDHFLRSNKSNINQSLWLRAIYTCTIWQGGQIFPGLCASNARNTDWIRSLHAQGSPQGIFDHIELPAKLLDYFVWSNKININQSGDQARRSTTSSRGTWRVRMMWKMFINNRKSQNPRSL